MRSRILLILLISLILLGCSGVGKPIVKGVENRWGNVTDNFTEIITEVVVYNPNPFPIPVKDVLTEVYMNSLKVGEGKSLQSEIKARTTSTILISTKIDNRKIPEWWVSHIKNGERSTLSVKGYLLFDLKITTFRFELPEIKQIIETNFLSGITSETQSITFGPYRITVESVRAKWGIVNDEITQVIASVKVRNENNIPLYLSKMNYEITANGIVLGEGYTNVDRIVQPKSSADVPAIFNIQTEKIRDWWVSHIRKGERSVVEIAISPYVEIGGREYSFNMKEIKFNVVTHMLE